MNLRLFLDVANAILLVLVLLKLLLSETAKVGLSIARSRVPVPDTQSSLRRSSDSGSASKTARVRQIRGKYAHLGISSEGFAAQKQEEIRLEDRK
jgi:hypothetical protein